MPDEPTDEGLLAARIRVPDHVVHRSFVAETVVLNLQTGRYHGLNPSAGRMLELLEASDTIGEAARTMAAEYDAPQDRIEADFVRFCRDLIDRRLIEMVGEAPG